MVYTLFLLLTEGKFFLRVLSQVHKKLGGGVVPSSGMYSKMPSSGLICKVYSTAYCQPVYIVNTGLYPSVHTVQYSTDSEKYNQFSCDLCLLHLYVRGIGTSTIGNSDVITLHAAYRRAYVLSLLTWPRTCTRPRHAHRGSEALSLSRAPC